MVRLGGLAVLAAAAACCLAAAPAQADVKWLCRPGIADNPCRGDLTTRYFRPNGTSRVKKHGVPLYPRVDCFYVYPTTSNQPTPNASKSADPEIRSIAKYQAQRFSRRCRVFVPLYRQVTTAGVARTSRSPTTPRPTSSPTPTSSRRGATTSPATTTAAASC